VAARVAGLERTEVGPNLIKAAHDPVAGSSEQRCLIPSSVVTLSVAKNILGQANSVYVHISHFCRDKFYTHYTSYLKHNSFHF